MKIYVYIAVALVFLGLQWAAYDYGRQSEREKAHRAVEEFREREASLIEQIEQAKKNIKVVTNERIKIVKETAGVCLDERIPSPLLDSLRNDLPPG